MKRPILSSFWDRHRQDVTYKISVEGVNKYLLFTDESLADLQRQITTAVKARHAGPKE